MDLRIYQARPGIGQWMDSKMRLFHRSNHRFLFVVLSVILLVGQTTGIASATTLDSITYNTPWYKPGDTACMGSSTTNVTVSAGSNTGPHKVDAASIKTTYAAMVKNGFTPAQAAGITGNLMWESGGDWSGVIADSTQGGGGGGYGIAQWTGSRRTDMETWVTGRGGDPKSLTDQLDFLWHELQTSYSGSVTAVKATSTPGDAAKAFMDNFEHPAAATANLDMRQQFAAAVFSTYSGSTVITSDAASACDNSSATDTGSPDCASAAGTLKILCEAKKYDPASYREVYEAGHQGGEAWHKTCPTINASCILDCSGLVTVATYDAFGNKGSWVTTTLVTDSANWKHINLSDVKPGDLIEPNPGHVEIIDHIKGGIIYTFGAHSSHYPQPRQVGPSSFSVSSSNVYLHYVGVGAS